MASAATNSDDDHQQETPKWMKGMHHTTKGSMITLAPSEMDQVGLALKSVVGNSFKESLLHNVATAHECGVSINGNLFGTKQREDRLSHHIRSSFFAMQASLVNSRRAGMVYGRVEVFLQVRYDDQLHEVAMVEIMKHASTRQDSKTSLPLVDMSKGLHTTTAILSQHIEYPIILAPHPDSSLMMVLECGY